MKQIFVCKKVVSSMLRAVLYVSIIFFSSCTDENVGEYKLTGDISSLIPDNAYDLSVTKSESYISFAPYLSSNFEVWGLKVSKVDYYVDDKLYLSTDSEPFDVLLKQSSFESGKHSLKAEMYIVGEYCDETVLEVTDEFYVGTSVNSDYVDIYIDYNRVENGGVLVVKPILNIERSSPGTKIDRVQYYWDGELAKTLTKAPFVWDSQIVNEEGEPHTWSAVVYYSNASGSHSYNYTFSNYKTLKDDDDHVSFDLMSSRKEYEAGETVSSIIKTYQGRNSNRKISIKLYFDDVLIGESSTFPYKNDFKLTNQKEGIHVLKCAITYDYGDTSITSYIDERIIVTSPRQQ